jgi:hypothetical protein
MKLAKPKVDLLKRQLLPPVQDLVPLAIVNLALFSAFNTLLFLFLAGKLHSLANKSDTFVQLVDGQIYYISERESAYRYPAVIKKVVTDWLTLTFNWESKRPGEKPDEGRQVADNQKVTSSAYQASFLLEPNFRQASLLEIAKLTPAEVFTGDVRAVIVVSYLSEPREVSVGVWELDLVATRVVVSRSGGDVSLPFNRTLKVKSVPIMTLNSNATDEEKQIYSLRSAGLEIVDIKPFTPK